MAKIDDSVKKKVPELRFKGFTDDWEERKLGELSNIVVGFAYLDFCLGPYFGPLYLCVVFL